MSTHRRSFGTKSESIAANFLKQQGYKILEQNYRTKLGEIDIIARQRGTLVFVEVKSRRSRQYGNPKWSITPKKKRKISMVALLYLKATRQSGVKARFDVVAIDSTHENLEIELIKNAFELAYE